MSIELKTKLKSFMFFEQKKKWKRYEKINPMNFGATMGALREMTLATGDLRTFAFMLAYFEGVMKNYSLQLSETDFTGEKIDDVRDSDGDGIIQSDLADGKYGIAPVLASEVQVEPIR